MSLMIPGWVCRVIRSNLKFYLAVVFLSKNQRSFLSNDSAYQPCTNKIQELLKTDMITAPNNSQYLGYIICIVSIPSNCFLSLMIIKEGK